MFAPLQDLSHSNSITRRPLISIICSSLCSSRRQLSPCFDQQRYLPSGRRNPGLLWSTHGDWWSLKGRRRRRRRHLADMEVVGGGEGLGAWWYVRERGLWAGLWGPLPVDMGVWAGWQPSDDMNRVNRMDPYQLCPGSGCANILKVSNSKEREGAMTPAASWFCPNVLIRAATISWLTREGETVLMRLKHTIT